MEFKPMQLPNDHNQWLETRQFQIAEIARIFRVPNHLINDLSRATFSNIEHQSIDFVVHSVRPYLVRWEQEISRKLFTKEERKKFFAEFKVDGLLRGDTKSRYEAYSIGKNSGFLTTNEIRKFENLNNVEGGDKLLEPLNMAPADSRELSKELSRDSQSQIEVRAKSKEQLSKERIRLTHAFRSVFEDSAERIIKREVTDLKRNSKKFLGDGNVREFERWLDSYYDEKHSEYISKAFKSPVRSLGESIQTLAFEEVGSELRRTPDFDERTDKFVSLMGKKVAGRNKTILLGVMEKNKRNVEEMNEQVLATADKWAESRATTIANRELHLTGNNFTKSAFAFAGVTRLIWIASGSDTCPICEEMDGKVVDINRDFAGAGDQVADLSVGSNVSHPPIHDGCSCTISSA
jgi:hypothetical protein